MATATPKKFEIGQSLMLASHDFHQRLALDLKRRGVKGVSARHRAVFLYLKKNGASRSVELAAAAAIRPQSMMKIVHELEQMQLVRRRPDPADSRAKLIEFTNRGKQLISELTRSTELIWDQYAAIVGEHRLTQVLQSLEEISAYSQEHGYD